MQEIKGAALLMEKFFESGKYRRKKQCEANEEVIKEVIKERFPQDEKKVIFETAQVIAEWQAYNVYEVDHLGLNEYLFDLGILQEVATIEKKHIEEHYGAEEAKAILQKCKLYAKYDVYARLNPKRGLYQIDTEDYSAYPFEKLPYLYRANNQELKAVNAQYESLRAKMKHCPLLREHRKLECQYGSVTLQKSKPVYDVREILLTEGPDFLIKYGKVNISNLDKFVTRGIIEPKEIDAFRKIVDVKKRFIVMDLETKAKQIEYMNKKTQQIAEVLHEKWKFKLA